MTNLKVACWHTGHIYKWWINFRGSKEKQDKWGCCETTSRNTTLDSRGTEVNRHYYSYTRSVPPSMFTEKKQPFPSHLFPKILVVSVSWHCLPVDNSNPTSNSGFSKVPFHSPAFSCFPAKMRLLVWFSLRTDRGFVSPWKTLLNISFNELSKWICQTLFKFKISLYNSWWECLRPLREVLTCLL